MTENGRGKGCGLLRIDYDEPGGDDLAFLHDPEGDSRFSKFVEKESAKS